MTKAATATKEPQPGESLNVPYPFVRDVFTDHEYDDEGGSEAFEIPTWRPGTRFEQIGREGEITECYADAMGLMTLTVVSVHRPGTFPTRVFFLRSWVNPDGKAFGKRKLRMTTVNAFRELTRGYRHQFEMAPQFQAATPLLSSL